MLLVCSSVCPFVRHAFWSMPYLMNHACSGISYMDSSWKNSWSYFFFLSGLCPFLELCSFEKIRMKSCQQDISKVFLGQLIWGWWVDYLINFWTNFVNFFPRVMALCKFWHFKLVNKISRKLFELGAWSMVADRGWWVVTWLTLEQISVKFSRVMALCKFGHFKLVSKISQKVFELGAWNLVSW